MKTICDILLIIAFCLLLTEMVYQYASSFDDDNQQDYE